VFVVELNQIIIAQLAEHRARRRAPSSSTPKRRSSSRRTASTRARQKYND
jgi:hypothetical protein